MCRWRQKQHERNAKLIEEQGKNKLSPRIGCPLSLQISRQYLLCSTAVFDTLDPTGGRRIFDFHILWFEGGAGEVERGGVTAPLVQAQKGRVPVYLAEDSAAVTRVLERFLQRETNFLQAARQRKGMCCFPAGFLVVAHEAMQQIITLYFLRDSPKSFRKSFVFCGPCIHPPKMAHTMMAFVLSIISQD